MEIQNLQKGLIDKVSFNSVDDRNVFIRKTFGLLLIEYIFVCGISLLTIMIEYQNIIWVFGVLMFICQLCHFYFEFGQQQSLEQNNKMLNYVSILIYLISFTFTFCFFWLMMIYIIGTEAWIANLQLGLVILFLSFYTNITETHLETATSWIIAMVTPITIEFIVHFIYYYYWSYPSSQLQTFITIIITWYSCFMLQISQDFVIERNFSFDQIQIATCKLLGAQYQIIVMLVKFFMKRNNNQNNLVMTDQNEKFEYFKQVTASFITFIMITFLYLIYGQYGFMIEYFEYDETYLIAFLKPIFWVSLSFSIVFYYVIIILHRKINNIIKWLLFTIQFIFNLFVVIGITYYLVYNNYNLMENYNYIQGYKLQNYYLMEIAFCMFSGMGIGLQSYSLIYKEDINYIKAFMFGMICPTLIFISQIYYISLTQDNGEFIGYIFAILVVFTAYLCLILYELHQQMNSDRIDFDTNEYYLGAMIIFQPIKTITIRVTSFFI